MSYPVDASANAFQLNVLRFEKIGMLLTPLTFMAPVDTCVLPGIGLTCLGPGEDLPALGQLPFPQAGGARRHWGYSIPAPFLFVAQSFRVFGGSYFQIAF